MARLRSEQEMLSISLSRDPDYILDQCGDILSMNEYKDVQKQPHAVEKTKRLLSIIIDKGTDACESFLDILKQNEGRYQDLHQFFNPSAHGSPTPTVFADDGSVVMAREITNTTAKSLSVRVEVVSKAEGNLPRNPAPSQASYTATDNSVICNDRINNAIIHGDINYTVSVKPSQDNPGTRNNSGPAQGPAVKWLIKHKVDLIACLRADLFILQYVHERQLVTDRQYDNLKHTSPPETTATNLIDELIGNGQEACEKFLQVLKEPDVLQTYPQLRNILNFDA